MSRFDRRSMLGYSLLGAGASALSGLPVSAASGVRGNPYAGDGAEKWVIDDTSAVAETASGTVAGYIRGGVKIFKGVPYAEITSPEGRWLRGSKVRPWAGKRAAKGQGLVCPSGDISPNGNELSLRDVDYAATRMGEDCLHVNVWTPATDNKKRQVLFYTHGGGFISGNAIMGQRFEGYNLARYGDVVVVSVNHRLNGFGYLNLSAYGDRYADSGNIGMLDVVDALKWVRTNIANFGGDPEKVMIFGHSGGGSKILTLVSMPETKGLYSRAIAHSPGEPFISTPEQSAALTSAFLKLVNVSPDNIGALNKLSTETVRLAAIAANNYDARAGLDKRIAPPHIGWRPVVDGRNVLYHPTRPTIASDIPLMIGTTSTEVYWALDHPEYAQMTEAQAREIVRDFCGPVGDTMYDVYKGAFPKAAPFVLSAMVRTCGHTRAHCAKIAQRRSAFNAAPTYNYLFHWEAGTFEGRAMSHHEIEMPLVFMNADLVPNVSGGTEAARTLSLRMADAWLAFARTGNPNTKALPHWDPFTGQAQTAMVFDNECQIDHGADLPAVEAFWKAIYPNT